MRHGPNKTDHGMEKPEADTDNPRFSGLAKEPIYARIILKPIFFLVQARHSG